MTVGNDELTAIDSALASGVLVVRHSDGRQVTFKNTAELRQARQAIVDKNLADCGTRRRRTVRLYQSGKGF